MTIFISKYLVNTVNHCSSEPCKNGGKCSNTEDGFSCECQQKFKGFQCESEAYCSPDRCLNGGTCQELENGYRCLCTDDFSGFRCLTKGKKFNVDDVIMLLQFFLRNC